MDMSLAGTMEEIPMGLLQETVALEEHEASKLVWLPHPLTGDFVSLHLNSHGGRRWSKINPQNAAMASKEEGHLRLL